MGLSIALFKKFKLAFLACDVIASTLDLHESDVSAAILDWK
jgi:hypothetical protein